MAGLAANVATAGMGTVSRIIAGWPALALLTAVKLLAGMLEHQTGGDRPATSGSRPRERVPEPATATGNRPARPSRAAVPDGKYLHRTGTVPAASAGRPSRCPDNVARPTAQPPVTVPDAARDEDPTATVPSADGPRPTGQPSHKPDAVPDSAPDISAILPVARAAWDGLRHDGQRLTRDALAARLRDDGHTIRNARLTPLLHALRQW